MDVIAIYKKDSDPMFQQLVAQERQLHKLHAGYRQRIKAEKKKEKERAVAMFGGSGLGFLDVNEKSTSIETNAGNTLFSHMRHDPCPRFLIRNDIVVVNSSAQDKS